MSNMVLSTAPLVTAGSAGLVVWLYVVVTLTSLAHQLSLSHSSLLNDPCLWKEASDKAWYISKLELCAGSHASNGFAAIKN